MKRYWSSIVFWGALWGFTEATLGYVLHSLSLNIGWVLWFPLAFCFIDSVYRKTNNLNSIIFTSFIAATIKMVDFIMPVSPDRVVNPAVSIIFEGLAVFVLFKSIENRQAAVYGSGYSPGCDISSNYGSNPDCDISSGSGSDPSCGVSSIPDSGIAHDTCCGAAGLGYPGVLSASFGWRILYIIYMLLMPESFAGISPLRSVSTLLSFLGSECMANCLLIFGYLKISELIVKRAGRKGGVIKRLKAHKGLYSALEVAFSGVMLSAALLAQWKL